MDAIATENLTKIYKDLTKGTRKSLDAVNLNVMRGEVFGFLGRNGAGKTTTIKLLCGLLRPSSGEARIFGESVRDRKARRLVGYLPEQPYFYEYLTPRETIEFYGRLQGLDRQQRRETWERLEGLLQLDDIADRCIKGFSKGMRQRVGFAVALVGDPPLLILDEPMSGLDPVGRRSIRELILRCRDEGKTVFFSSHVLGDVEMICDRIGILVTGRLTQQGRIDELLAHDVGSVEVVASGLAAAGETELISLAQEHRRIEGRLVLSLTDPLTANRAVQRLHALGGTLEGYTPIKTRLEDYFIQEQERQAAQEAGIS